MQNLLVEMLAAATLFSAPAISPALTVPTLESKQLHSHKVMIVGKPEEKLQTLLDQCTTPDDVERLAKSFDAVAKIYEDKSDHNNAEVCYLMAIRLKRMYLPKTSPELAAEYERLAAHYSLVDQGDKARNANLKALQIYKANGNQFAVELAVIEHNQAWLELYSGRNNAAEHYLKHCLKLLKSALGQNHELVGLISSSLGELYMCDGNLAGAEKLFRTALEILPRTPEADEVSDYVRNNYALVQERLGKKSEQIVHGQIK
ncbi:MAG TPA: tetratricopeptide repeat protein [Drouetiella sp.]|jgi:tetratricopeptide (TPR) repeat protein